MTARLDPLVSEFETDEQAESYDQWFRAKVLEAMMSAKPRIAHDEPMARVRAQVAEKRAAGAGPPVE
ncbi:MAG TPA: hypothetical protein VFC47_01545 [Caulobacteraceae bacterium]|nr:hypothetical protein [Caulobacteraceae bacterium]